MRGLCYDWTMRHLLSSVFIVLGIGCMHVAGPTVDLGEQFTLAPSETAQLKEAGISVTFNGVEGDSRCPADVVCIQGGDARVKIEVVSSGRTRGYELHTGDLKPVVHDGLTIALVDLTPYPFSSRPVRPADYRATLSVSR